MKRPQVSICITTLNEEKSIEALLDSLIHQTRKPDEIVIVDAGSADGTIRCIKNYELRIKYLKLIVRKGATIAEGRNIAVKSAKYDVIAMTDAGCVADKYWLERITKPLMIHPGGVQVVAGFYRMQVRPSSAYRMSGTIALQRALAPFLGVTPEKFNEVFLPSTRSIAFTKSIWQKVGGFDEKFDRAGEDSDFNAKLQMLNVKLARTKKAIVYWEMPKTLISAFSKFYFYARGDAQTKSLTSHNVKVLFVFLRYYLGFAFLGLALGDTTLLPVFILIVFGYFFWAYRKAGLWGIGIQIISDIAVMSGAISGILGM